MFHVDQTQGQQTKPTNQSKTMKNKSDAKAKKPQVKLKDIKPRKDPKGAVRKAGGGGGEF